VDDMVKVTLATIAHFFRHKTLPKFLTTYVSIRKKPKAWHQKTFQSQLL